jgi:arylsulfatase A-like enzyme
MKLFSTLALSILVLFQALPLFAKGKAEHVVVMVWDGMRPDFISPQHTPTLYDLAKRGVFFKNHHAIYISSTEVNGTAIATGGFPDRSGIMANRDYRPLMNWLGTGATEDIDVIRRADFLSSGKFIRVPTLPEILQAAGYATITAGTKPVVVLHDRSNQRGLAAAAESVNLYQGRTLPRAVLDIAIKANKDQSMPTNSIPNSAQDAWTTKAVTHGFWSNGVPKYTLLWMSDPDYSQHATSPGDDTVLTALESDDKNLASILKTLDEKKVLDKTDIFVVSDHGFSTVERQQSVTNMLRKAKFKAFSRFEDPEPGDVLVAGLGGSVALYVWDHDEAVILRLVEFLQSSDFAGAIFTRLKIPGTFPFETVHINTPDTEPDIVFSARWNMNKNSNGAPGLLWTDGAQGKGTHGSLSPSDMHNTLVAAGPDFKTNYVNDLPTGNIDVAPTILYLLGVAAPTNSPMQGRVIQEALVDGKKSDAKPNTRVLEASRDIGIFHWSQYLKVTEYGGATYIDEGNGQTSWR